MIQQKNRVLKNQRFLRKGQLKIQNIRGLVHAENLSFLGSESEN